MKTYMTAEEIESRRQQLMQDIQFVDKNLLGISSLIVKEIGTLEMLKNGINLYKFDGIKIDRKNNSAQVFDLTTFERQLTREMSEVLDAITLKQNFITYLTKEHTRIQTVKKNLEKELKSLPSSPSCQKKSQSTQKTSQRSQTSITIDTKK